MDTSHIAEESTRLLIAELLGDREVVAFRPSLARSLGSPLAALFLCQALYWQHKVGEGKFWFKVRDAKKDENGVKVAPINSFEQSWEWELGMSRSEQETARKILKKNGLLNESLEGVPARLHYMVDLSAVHQFLIKSKPHPVGRIPPTGKQKAANKAAKSCLLDGDILPSITKTTQKITQETTHRRPGQKNENFIFPKKIKTEEKIEIQKIIKKSTLKMETIQQILDEVEGMNQKKGIKEGMVNFFLFLMKAAELGQFTPRLCIKIKTARIKEDDNLPVSIESTNLNVKTSFFQHELLMNKTVAGLPVGKAENFKLIGSMVKLGTQHLSKN